MRHQHTTPLEMCEFKLRVKLLNFVARQWIRHRTASDNEYSARYSIFDREFYVPGADVTRAQSRTNRQGHGARLSSNEAQRVQELLRADVEACLRHYVELLNEPPDGASRDEKQSRLARELARLNLSLSFYTQWYWKIDLHNLLHFLALRAGDHAQFEIRVYAEAILERVVKAWLPLDYEANCVYRMNSGVLLAGALSVVRALVEGRRSEMEALRNKSGVSARELRS